MTNNNKYDCSTCGYLCLDEDNFQHCVNCMYSEGQYGS